MVLATMTHDGGSCAAVQTEDGWRTLPYPGLSALLAAVPLQRPADPARLAGDALTGVRTVRPPPSPADVVCCGLDSGDPIAVTGRAHPSHPTLFPKYSDTLLGPGEDSACPVTCRSKGRPSPPWSSIGRSDAPVGTRRPPPSWAAPWTTTSRCDQQVHNEAGFRSVPNHHGEAETGGFVLSGGARISVGADFADSVDMSDGDWVFVPPPMPPVECNLDRDAPLTWMTARTPDNIVVNLPDVSDDLLRDWSDR